MVQKSGEKNPPLLLDKPIIFFNHQKHICNINWDSSLKETRTTLSISTIDIRRKFK